MKNSVPPGVQLEQCYTKRSIKEHRTEQLVCAAWHFAKRAIWPRHTISFSDAEASKDFIRSYLYLHGDSEKAFKSFCTRILLAKEYYVQFPERKITAVKWLSADNDEEGFAITLDWYNQLLYRRQHADNVRHDFDQFTNLLLRYTLKPHKSLVDIRRKFSLNCKRSDLSRLLESLIRH